MRTASKDLIRNKSVILLHGIFKRDFFDSLKREEGEKIFVLEGRPSLKAAHSSCGELLKRGIEPTLITDNMAGFLFYKNLVKKVCLSYQLKDQNGFLCSVGGLILAVLARRHGVPVQMFLSNGTLTLMGKPKELCYLNGSKVVAGKINTYVPLVEWVPNKYLVHSA